MLPRPRICFIGSMLGHNPGCVTTQGQITADLFSAEGYEVVAVSSKMNRLARLAEIAAVLIKERHRFDLVLIEVYSGLSFIIAEISSLLCRLFKLPLILVLHGGNLPEFVEKHPRRAKRVLSRAASLVAPSAFLAKAIQALGFDVRVIPNIVELDQYPFRERSRLSPRLVWMRSFHSIYNPEMAVNVLAELRKSYPAASLTMAGVDKGLEPEIKKMAAKMNLSDAITFPGFLDARQKMRVFSEANIYLNTTRLDNMPVALLEARAFGLPVVATNVGGIPFLISHGQDGLLVENENVSEMVEAVKLLLKDSDLARKISRGGRLYAERSAWTVVRTDWEALFSEVLDQRAERPVTPLSRSGSQA